jgi:S1-C subfamily serine protease
MANTVLTDFSNALAAAVETAGASIVRVDSRKRGNPASGIVWRADGLIVTADHALEREEDITIGLADGRELPATIVGRDPSTDIAVLKIQADGLTAATIGTDPKVGNFVLAVGRPGQIAATIGVVSTVGGPGRTWRGGKVEGFIRTDATIYPGFSGGPLVDASGAVVGMTTTHFGQGAVILIATLNRVSEALIGYGRIRRGYLGVTSQPVQVPESLRASVGQESGLLVVGVETGGPAEQGGLFIGDTIVSFNNAPIRDTDELQNQLTADRIGQQTPVTVLRGGVSTPLTITVGERP